MGRQLLKGRLCGHPVHPMLVHFPTALFTAGFLFDAGGIALQEPSFYMASFYVILLGLAGGVLAGLFGLIDYMNLGTEGEVFQKASWHAGIQFVVLMVFGIIAGLKYRHYPDPVISDWWQLGVMGVVLAVMVAGNYLGGELVFTHQVGVNENSDG